MRENPNNSCVGDYSMACEAIKFSENYVSPEVDFGANRGKINGFSHIFTEESCFFLKLTTVRLVSH